MDPTVITFLAALGMLTLIGCLSLARRWLKVTLLRSSAAPDEGADSPEDKQWIVAFVWPKKDATSQELKALGHELAAWKPNHPLVTRIDGLGALLAGKYPLPDGTTPYAEDPDGELMPVPCRKGGEIGMELRRMSVVDPWLYCPALVYASGGMGSDQAIGSLKRAIPPELVNDIGYSIS